MGGHPVVNPPILNRSNGMNDSNLSQRHGHKSTKYWKKRGETYPGLEIEVG